jgi:hypothetical protein
MGVMRFFKFAYLMHFTTVLMMLTVCLMPHSM